MDPAEAFALIAGCGLVIVVFGSDDLELRRTWWRIGAALTLGGLLGLIVVSLTWAPT